MIAEGPEYTRTQSAAVKEKMWSKGDCRDFYMAADSSGTFRHVAFPQGARRGRNARARGIWNVREFGNCTTFGSESYTDPEEIDRKSRGPG